MSLFRMSLVLKVLQYIHHIIFQIMSKLRLLEAARSKQKPTSVSREIFWFYTRVIILSTGFKANTTMEDVKGRGGPQKSDEQPQKKK